MYDPDLLNRAFQLAHFICRDRAIALGVVIESLAKLEVAAAAQHKRIYYVPAKRRQRTKVSMGELGLLQRLIYIETTHHEREQERSGRPLTEEEMIIRYVKHLVKITVRRNSFYVALGIGRLLYNYSTSETSMIYDLIVQDPDRSKDDYYYRSRKNKLIQEILERFGQMVSTIKGPRGEIRFEVQEEPGWRSELVSRCLDLFTPWGTACAIPERFDPMRDSLSKLSFAGGDPDAEHPVEVNRMHAIIHPSCYKKLTRALGLDSPDLRLAIPKFFASGGDRPNRGEPSPELNQEEISALEAELMGRSSRRLASSGLLAVIVDGAECAVLDLSRSSRARFQIPGDAELIEIWSREDGGRTLLATHLIGHEEEAASITLEAGQEISFRLSPLKSSSEEAAAAIAVDLAYKETNPIRAARLLWRRIALRASQSMLPRVWKPALALALIAAATIFFLRLARAPGPVTKIEPPRGESAAQAPKGAEPTGEQKPPLVARERAGRIQPSPEATRGPKLAREISLASIKRIYVDSLGEGDFANRVRKNIVAELQQGGFAVTDNLEEAQAAIKGSASGNASGIATIKLVGPDGNVLWSTSARGQADQVARESIRRLINRIKREGDGSQTR